MDFLIFQLYGPMASWGDIAVGEVRPSQNHPSKSAISGLLAGALGIAREEGGKHIKIDQDYGTAVRMFLPGEILRDYHTVQMPEGGPYNSRREELSNREKLHTVLSYRDFYMDAFYQIAVWGKQDKTLFSLEEIQQALLAPRFPLYLGKKSHPLSLPACPMVFSGLSLKKAFEKYPLDKGKIWIDKIHKGNLMQKSNESGTKAVSSFIRYFWEKDLLKENAGMTPDMSVFKRDRIFNRRKWLFNEREEYQYSESK